MANKLTAAALVLAGAGLASTAIAQTALTSTQSTTAAQFNTTQSQFRNGAGTSTFVGTTSTTSPTLVPISKFDTNTGILVGARMSVNIPYTISMSALGTVPASGTGRTVDVTGTVAGSVTIAGTSISTAGLIASPKCFAGDCGNLSKNNTDSASGTLTGTAAVAGANLAALAGAGAGTVNFSSQVNATNTQIVNGTAVTQGQAYTQFMLGGTTASANQYSVAYDYLNFSRPSFTTPSQTTAASVNFGTVFRNSGTRTQAFSVNNLVNTANGGVAANTSAASLTGVTRATNDGTLSTTLTSLSNLGGGNTSSGYAIAFNPTSTGAKSDTFTFAMTDTPLVGGVAATGAVGMRTTNLTYAVSANVVDRASPSFSTSGVVTTTSANFGNVYRDAGTQTSAALTLANVGGSAAVPANLDSVTTTGGYTTTLSSGIQVLNGTPQSFTTAFNPGAGASGLRGGTVVLALSDVTTGMASGTTANSYTLTVNTSATVWDHANPQFAATPTGRTQSINFGTVYAGSTATASFALTNVADAGTNRVAVSLNSINNAGAGAFSTNLAPLSGLAAGNTTANYTASVNSSTAGTNNGTIVLNMADVAPTGGIAGANSNYQLTLNTTANVINHATPSLSTGSVVTSKTVNFGTFYVGSAAATQSLIVANLGNPANTAGMSLVGTARSTNDAAFGTTLTSLTNLAAGSSQAFNASYNPNVVGTRSDTFTYSMQDYAPGVTGAVTSSLVVTTTGTAINHATPSLSTTAAVTSQTIDFGTRFAGSGTATQNFVVANLGNPTNTAGMSLVGTSRSTNDASFGTTLTALSNLAAGSSQSFQASFNPNAVGTRTDSFTYSMQDYAPGVAGALTSNVVVTTTGKVINYANPSFNGLTVETSKTLDFGTVSSRGGPVLLNFSLFNIGDANSAGLELYQINGPGNSLFTSNVSTFLNLAGGASNNYSVSFNPLNLGVANGLYTFLFRDYAPGVAGIRNYTLTLNIAGNVFDPVPEPGTWMTMLLGFGLVGAVARRRPTVTAR